jgi:hypothetical protein
MTRLNGFAAIVLSMASARPTASATGLTDMGFAPVRRSASGALFGRLSVTFRERHVVI